jgi:hypothetical protein
MDHKYLTKRRAVNNFTTNIGHICIAVVIIVAAVVLAIKGTITGGDAIALIGAAGGVSLGGAVASSSAGAPVPSSVASLISQSAPNGHGTTPTNSTTTTTSTTIPNSEASSQ